MNKFGTKEWAESNFNFNIGCSNDCVYCYAKEMSIRFKRKTSDTWKNMENCNLSKKSFSKRNGKIMLPSSHDITQSNIYTAITVIEKLLDNGNQILIVSKPNPVVINMLTDYFVNDRRNLEFRFTIGSCNNSVLKLWEPNAPKFEERLLALKIASDIYGFKTSVSCEPLLDNNFDELYNQIEKYTNEIWVGKMNLARKRIITNTNGNFSQEKVNELLTWQSDKNILNLVDKYKDNPKIKWKDSIQKVINKYKEIK